MFSINFRTNSQVRCQVLKLDTKKVLRYIGIWSLKKDKHQLYTEICKKRPFLKNRLLVKRLKINDLKKIDTL